MKGVANKLRLRTPSDRRTQASTPAPLKSALKKPVPSSSATSTSVQYSKLPASKSVRFNLPNGGAPPKPPAIKATAYKTFQTLESGSPVRSAGGSRLGTAGSPSQTPRRAAGQYQIQGGLNIVRAIGAQKYNQPSPPIPSTTTSSAAGYQNAAAGHAGPMRQYPATGQRSASSSARAFGNLPPANSRGN